MLRRELLVICALFSIGFVAQARASGTFSDTFSGTSLDTNTWQDWPQGEPQGSGTTLTVNNSLTLTATDGYDLDVKTKTYKMSVGQQLNTTLQILSCDINSGIVMMGLTNDSTNGSSVNYDTRQFGIWAYSNGIFANVSADLSGVNYAITGAPSLNTTYKFQIDRTGIDSAVFRVRNGSGTLLGSYTISSLSSTMGGSPQYPSDMNVFLNVQVSSAKFTEVTVTPEPGFGLVASGLMVFGCWRRRTVR